MSHQNLQLAAVGTSQPSASVWQDQAWLARAIAAKESSSPNESGWIKREPSPATTSSSSSSDELGELSGSNSPASPGWGNQAAGDTAVGAVIEQSFQPWSDDIRTKNDIPASSEESEIKDLSFLKQLWKIACSDEFQSIRRVDDGVFVAINEEMFKREVLARRGPGRVFEMESMESFHRQLDLHGMRELPEASNSSDSRDEFPTEEATAPRKLLHFYYSPNFKRDHPQVLTRCKPRVGHKRRAPAASYLDEELEESCPSGSCQGLQPAQGAAAGVEEAFAPAPLQDTPASPPWRSPPTKRQAKAPPGLSSAPNPSQAPAPLLPDPAGAAGRESFWAAPSLAPPPSSQAPAGLQRAAPAPHQAAAPTPQLPPLAPGLGVSPAQ